MEIPYIFEAKKVILSSGSMHSGWLTIHAAQYG
jgi:hypothetical protein